MKNYEKPVVMVNEGLAEGVYAASGDCWSGSGKSVQTWNGSHQEFEIKIVHTNAVEHISSSATVKVYFSSNINPDNVGVDSCTFVSAGSNYVEVIRYAHANAYGEGDQTTFKIRVASPDGTQATTTAIALDKVVVTGCDRTVNVQGGID